MKFTDILHKQHIGRAVRSLWQHQRERYVKVMKTEEILSNMGIPVKDALEVINPKKNLTRDIIQKKCKNTQPAGMGRCLSYKSHNVLQEGVSQACLLTNTLQINNDLPKQIKDLETDIPENVDNLVKRIICTSSIYDAQQVKLPVVKDPNRPSWVFPRDYGITSTRKMLNLSKKFLQLCESLCGLKLAQNRLVVHNGDLSVCIDKEPDLLHFNLKADMMMTSSKPLTPIADANAYNELSMPNIYPLYPTIGLTKLYDYRVEDVYPISMKSALINAHTIFVNHDPEEVKNLTELPVTEDQIHARSMISAFTTAVICARKKYGFNVRNLDKPITVQCIQSDGQTFHFSVYQLNSIIIDGTEGVKNFWWSFPSIKLYETAGYKNGKPCLEGYNNEVFRKFLAFYKNE